MVRRQKTKATPETNLAYFGAFPDTVLPNEPFADCNYGDLAILKTEMKWLGKGEVITPRDQGEKEILADALIVGGGGLIHPTETSTKWLCNIKLETMEALAERGCKIIIMAVGVNFARQKTKWPKTARSHLEFLCQNARYACGRDCDTVKFLAFHGAKTPRLCPDPALFLFGRDEVHRDIESEFFNVVWHPGVDDNTIEEIARKTHLTPRLMLQNEIHQFTEQWENVQKKFKCFPLAGLNQFLDNLKGANFTVSSSLHGMILSLSMGIPVVSLYEYRRIVNFQQLFLNHYDGFPCILDSGELEYVNVLAKMEHPGISNRKQTLQAIYESNIAAIREVLITPE